MSILLFPFFKGVNMFVAFTQCNLFYSAPWYSIIVLNNSLYIFAQLYPTVVAFLRGAIGATKSSTELLCYCSIVWHVLMMFYPAVFWTFIHLAVYILRKWPLEIDWLLWLKLSPNWTLSWIWDYLYFSAPLRIGVACFWIENICAKMFVVEIFIRDS